MTPDDIVEMTRRLGGFDATPLFLGRFAELVAQHERTACAEICDRMAARYEDMRGAALESAAESIRLRGQA